jgi:hypothetical protein
MKYLNLKTQFIQKSGAGLSIENDFSQFVSMVDDELKDQLVQKQIEYFNKLIEDLTKYNEEDITDYDRIIISIGACISPNETMIKHCMKEFIPEQFKREKVLVLSININSELLNENIINNIKKNMFEGEKKIFNGKEFILPSKYNKDSTIEHYLTLFPSNLSDNDSEELKARFTKAFKDFYDKYNDKLIIVNNAIFRENPHPLHISPILLNNVIDNLYIPINVLPFEDNVKIDFVYTSGNDYKLLIKADYLLKYILNYNEYDIFRQGGKIDLYVAKQLHAENTLNIIKKDTIKELIREGVIIYAQAIPSFIM